MNLDDLFKIEKSKDYAQSGPELIQEARRSLSFDGILGALKKVLEADCTSYGQEAHGKRCCFLFKVGVGHPCIVCKTRAAMGYPCPACKISHHERTVEHVLAELSAEAQKLNLGY